MAFFSQDRDRNVKVFNNGVAVSSSKAESDYSRKLNFKENFTISINTIGKEKVFDIVGNGYAIPQEGGVAQGSTNRPLNFNDAQFDIVEVTGSPGSYDISSTGRVKVNAISTIRPLSMINNGTDDAIVVTDNPSSTDVIEIKHKNDQVAVFSNGVQVGTRGRRLNFTGATITEDTTANNWFTIATGVILPDGTTTSRKYGILRGGTFNGEGYFTGLDTSPPSSSRTTTLTPTAIYTKWSNSGADERLAGFQTTGFITRRQYNPYYKIKFKTDTVGEKFMAGFVNSTSRPLSAPGGTTGPIDTKSGIVLGYDDTDTTYWIHYNDGTSPATAVNTTITNNDAGVFHTLEIIFSNSGSGSVTVKLDGTTYVNAATTNIPAATTDLCLFSSQEAAGSSNIDFSVEYAYLLQDV